MTAKKKPRSPLKVKPLRQAGESVAEARRDLAWKSIETVLLGVILVVFSLLDYVREILSAKPQPVLFAFVGAIVLVVGVVRFVRVLPRLEALKLARDGERIVGEVLDGLRGKGYQVFHDVVGAGFNVDHVLIGTGGIYAIETKTFSKRSPESKVLFDGDVITVDGFQPDRNPVIQSKAQAAWLRELITASTGRQVPVRPVVLFPGWFVEPGAGAKASGLWVLNENAFRKWLDNEKPVISAEDVNLVAFHLGQFVRSSQNQ